MRGPRTLPRWLVLAALALAGGACKQTDSILFVVVGGPNMLGATQFHVTVAAQPDARAFDIPEMPVADMIMLPASFTISLDRSHTGPVTVSVDAHDANNSTLASGTTTMQHINIGGETLIAVMLGDLPPDQPDGGADGASGSGQAGAGGKAGTGGGGSGGAGAGGTAGQGGASGMDAGTGGDGAMGLDGATD